MKSALTYLLILFFLLCYSKSNAQKLAFKELIFVGDTIQIDTVSIYRMGFTIYYQDSVVPQNEYFLDPIRSKIFFYSLPINSSIKCYYETMIIDLSQSAYHKNTSLINYDTTDFFEPTIYSVSTANTNYDFFGESKLNKQGSISRGITVGNSQSLSLQSTLNLQLDGQIAPNLFMQGSISDDNVPFQPEGNTQKLQEFDQVYLKVYNENFAVIGGDYWLYKPEGYFLNYTKRTQGLSIEVYHPTLLGNADGKTTHKLSGAFSKGKFARNIIQGVEGNQGPYKLKGAENETFIVVLAGTEKVYIDGKLLQRGQEFDYTIDYNTAEITFTANQLITKDKRIIVEFQYSDLNYARSLIAYNGNVKTEKYDLWFNIYSEQDAKNQTIQQNLTSEKKSILAEIGDSLNTAYSLSIDSVGFYDNRILYALVDSMSFDSILVFTNHPDSAFYSASFLFVGAGNGNYILDKYTANGKIYKWVMPIAGQPQGDYEPIQLLAAPQNKRMYNAGFRYHFTENINSSVEVAMSDQDLNTFSNLHDENNQGYAIKWKWNSQHKIATKTKIQSNANIEFTDVNFAPIQWFRDVEFDRDWNVRNKNFSGFQMLSNGGIKLVQTNVGSIGYDFENFIWGDDYLGYRNFIKLNVSNNGFTASGTGSLLNASGFENSQYIRHDLNIAQNIKWIKISFNDIHELNKIFDSNSDTLTNATYQFYDWKVGISTSDSILNKFGIYYQERYDWFGDTTYLKQATRAQNIGFNADFQKNVNNVIRLNLNYRFLDVLDTSFYNLKPENTLLGRVEHVLRLYKNAILATTFYEVGSGLELRREFIFLEVNPGQGTHTWIDYNNDNIKDLGEFENAVFADQGNYIRVFVPTNSYVRTYSNQFSTSLMLNPEKVWKSKSGIKKLISHFANQTIYKINRKTAYENQLSALNPFVYEIADSSLIAINTSFRNTLYFNKTNSIFGITYSYQELGSKILLSNGFDRRLNTFHDINIRWNFLKKYNLRLSGILGRKKNGSDYANNRNYSISFYEIEPIISFQPGTAFRISVNSKYTFKYNNEGLNEEAILKNIGVELRFNQAQKSSLSGQINYIIISYTGSENTSIAFEMLEGLRIGNNLTWGLNYQRKVAQNLQLNFTYTGRKSEDNNAVHAGGIELRAFF